MNSCCFVWLSTGSVGSSPLELNILEYLCEGVLDILGQCGKAQASRYHCVSPLLLRKQYCGRNRGYCIILFGGECIGFRVVWLVRIACENVILLIPIVLFSIIYLRKYLGVKIDKSKEYLENAICFFSCDLTMIEFSIEFLMPILFSLVKLLLHWRDSFTH